MEQASQKKRDTGKNTVKLSSVLTLAKQIQIKADPAFQELLQRVRQKKLNMLNVEILNKKVATSLSNTGSLKTVVVVQKNKSKHLINQIQINQFAQVSNWPIIIFLVEH